MNIVELIPGMNPDTTVRNLLLGVLYIVIASFLWIPILLLLIPYLVARNRQGLGDQFSFLPGVSSTGGVKTGVAMFSYGVMTVILISLVTATGGDGEVQAATPETTITPEEVVAANAVTETVQSVSHASMAMNTTVTPTTNTPTSTSTPVPTSTPTPTPDRVTTTAAPMTVVQTTSTPTLSPSPTGKSDNYYHTVMRMAIEKEQNVDVRNFYETQNVAQLSYTSSAASETQVGAEMGTVAGVVAWSVDNGWDAERVDVTMYSVSGLKAGTYYIERGWVEEYNTGQITMEELGYRVLTTIQSQY